MRVTKGRIVEYRSDPENRSSEAAMVCQTYGDALPNRVNLVVFSHDGFTRAEHAVDFDPEGLLPRSWRWFPGTPGA